MPKTPQNADNRRNRTRWCLLVLLSLQLAWAPAVVAAEESQAEAAAAEPSEEKPPKTGLEAIQPENDKCKKDGEKVVIGATAEFAEESSGFLYAARIDTGATTCSIHAEKIKVVEGVEVKKKGSKQMQKNIGRKVTFELIDAKGKRKRVESTIADTVRVKTSERKERRYKVWLTLRHGEVQRRVHVTLNDRSHMAYPLLIGRNFLCGRFLVDVEQKKTPMPSSKPDKAVAANDAKRSAADGS